MDYLNQNIELPETGVDPSLINLSINELETLAALKEKLKQEELLLAQYKEDNPIEFFSCNPAQLDFWIHYLNPQYRTFAYTGANKRGKTTIGCHLAISTMLGYIPYKLNSIDLNGKVYCTWEQVYQQIKQWEGVTWYLKVVNGIPLVHFIYIHSNHRKVRYIGQGWEAHVKDVVIPVLKKWWPKNHKVQVKKNQQGLEVYWTSYNGSYLCVMSNDQPAAKFAGKDDDLVILDEPIKKENYIELRRGTVVERGKLFIGATILAKEIWIDRELIKATNTDGTPDKRVYSSNGEMDDNLGFGIKSQADIDDFGDELLRLNPEEYNARIKGKPSYLSGIIHGIFDRPIHIKPRFRVPLDWIVDIAIDTHPKEPHAVMFIATTPRNFKYVVDEIWVHTDPKSLAELILIKIRQNCYRVINSLIIDPSSKGDSNNPETTYQKISAVLSPYRYCLTPASKSKDCVTDGIITVNDWLMTQNKEPALFFFNTLVRTFYEIESWMWNPKTGDPIDKDDHMMENMRRLIVLGTRWRPIKRYQPIGRPKNWRVV